MKIRALIAFALFASFAHSEEAPMPWAFVNGSAEGYSVMLESASPAPGTPLATGQKVQFKIKISYQLSIADSGAVILVLEDETDKSLSADRKQQSRTVNKGKGSVTLTDSLVVPAGSKEVRLFIPLVPKGLTNTSGELLIRYPVVDRSNASSIR